MKNLKSILALVMVIVITVCLSGCGLKSEEEATETEQLVDNSVLIEYNEEFSKWFTDVKTETDQTAYAGMLPSGLIISLEVTDHTYQNMSEPINATVTVGDKEYTYTDFKFAEKTTWNSDGSAGLIKITMLIAFGDIGETDYDSLTVTLIDNNNEEIAVTYYPGVG